MESFLQGSRPKVILEGKTSSKEVLVVEPVPGWQVQDDHSSIITQMPKYRYSLILTRETHLLLLEMWRILPFVLNAKNTSLAGEGSLRHFLDLLD